MVFGVYIYNYIIFQPKSVGRSVGQSTSRHIEVGRTRLRIGLYVIFNREKERVMSYSSRRGRIYDYKSINSSIQHKEELKHQNMCEYEIRRLENMKRNAEVLKALGLDGDSDEFSMMKASKKRKMKSSRSTTIKKQKKGKLKSTRRSKRIRKEPAPPIYVPEEFDTESSRRKLIKSKRKYKGDRFGEVKGVKEGRVFGAGDFQRLGRKEMSENGFFHPFVTPEFMERNGACYSIIVNNDNGLSKDSGDTILYAGSGGRMRGQNRTAKQSFHQTYVFSLSRFIHT